MLSFQKQTFLERFRAKMGFEIKLLPGYSAVFIAMEGQLSIALRKEALGVGVAELKRNHFKGLIIDVSNTSFGPKEVNTDALKLFKYMEILGMYEGVMLALVHPAPDERRKYFAHIAELFSFQAAYFPSIEEAKAWIRGA